MPPHYWAYAVAMLLIPLLTKDLMSFSRYALLAWPVFYVPVVLVREQSRSWVLGVISALLLVFQMGNMAAFVNWHWVG